MINKYLVRPYICCLSTCGFSKPRLASRARSGTTPRLAAVAQRRFGHRRGGVSAGACCVRRSVLAFRSLGKKRKRPRRAMMSNLRTTSSPRLAVHAAQEAMLQRGMDRVVTSDMDSAMNDEAKIERALVDRAEEMCRARNRKNRARRERKREKARAATIDALFMRDGSQAVGDAVCEETAEEKADEVARRQGALHPEQEAMAHSLSGYAGRSDQDRVMERAKECVAIMKHLYERAQEECARLEPGLAQANCERDKATAERDAAAAERDRALHG